MAVWTPLESNPDVLTKYIHQWGVSSEWVITDVLSLDSEMLDWLPKPVKSIILLFPISDAYEKHRMEEELRLLEKNSDFPKDLFYMRQYTHNACGTIALVHSIANNTDIDLGEGALKNFLNRVKEMSPEERGKNLENDAQMTQDHQNMAQEGQTTADPDEKVYHHFIALVNNNGVLYELDGRKTHPISHGTTSKETFVEDAAKVCKEFMARDPNELRFTVLALTAAQN